MSDPLNAKSTSAEGPQGADHAVSYFESEKLAMLIANAVTGGIVEANAAGRQLFELLNFFGFLTLANCFSASDEVRADFERCCQNRSP